MTEGALGGMMGLIPLTIGAGLVMGITDRMMGPKSSYGRNTGGRYSRDMDYDEDDRSYSRGGSKKMKVSVGKFNRKASVGRIKAKKAGRRPGGHKPNELSHLMKDQGRQVKYAVGRESSKVGAGSVGSLPGVGKITPGKLGSTGFANTNIFRQTSRDMSNHKKYGKKKLMMSAY